MDSWHDLWLVDWLVSFTVCQLADWFSGLIVSLVASLNVAPVVSCLPGWPSVWFVNRLIDFWVDSLARYLVSWLAG